MPHCSTAWSKSGWQHWRIRAEKPLLIRPVALKAKDYDLTWEKSGYLHRKKWVVSQLATLVEQLFQLEVLKLRRLYCLVYAQMLVITIYLINILWAKYFGWFYELMVEKACMAVPSGHCLSTFLLAQEEPKQLTDALRVKEYRTLFETLIRNISEDTAKKP